MKEFGLILKLLAIVALVTLFGDAIPIAIQESLLALSYLIKDILTFVIPFIVFVFIASSLLSFQRSAPALVLILLGAVVTVNYLVTFMGYAVGNLFMPDLSAIKTVAQATGHSALQPLFHIPLPQLMTTDVGLILGTLLGIGGTFWGSEKLKVYIDTCRTKLQWGLTHIFIPILPIYILGFLIKVQHDDSLSDMFANYAPILLIIIGGMFTAMLICYFVAANGNPRRTFELIKTALSSGLVGFSTISSAATMPVTLEAARKNTNNPKLVQLVIPATANINLIADSITTPVLIAAVYTVSGLPPMGMEAFLLFSVFYIITKFGVAAVPGGGMLVVTPFLETHFGFDAQMVGLIITLYILLDPFITAFNVMSNGAFAVFMNNLCGKMKAFQEEVPVAAQA